ncbi:MAG TPA: hypothetical protein VF288_10750 [Mycobacteriales bacterium]
MTEYYVFQGPDAAYVELWDDGERYVAPTAWRTVRDAIAGLRELHPGDLVESLDVEHVAAMIAGA